MTSTREVFEMTTKQVEPDLDSWKGQEHRQDQRSRNRRFGAFAVAAAIGLVALVVILATRPGEDGRTPVDEPTTVNPADAKAEELALSFLEAFGAFDAQQARTYLADSADITEMTEGRGVVGLSLTTSFWEAIGYQQTITSCQAGTVTTDTTVVCAFDFHAIRSDEIGLGPFSGSDFTITVRDGEIVRASMILEIERFSPQMWEPFRDWVSTTYPKDFAVMYTGGGSNFRLTEESIRLWEQRTREYVKEMQRRTAGQSVQGLSVDYVVDLDTGAMTPLPEAIIRSTGETGEGAQAESHYTASPDGSQLAYVGNGEEGSPQIFIADIDGTGIRQVTHDSAGADWPAWSPDGAMIAYVGGPRDLSDPGDLFVFDIARSTSTRIADEVVSPYAAGIQFAPDGASVVYTYSGSDSAAAEMRTVPVAGGQSTILFGAGHGGMGHAASGSFSPDGSLVTMTGHEIDGPGAAVFVSNADGTQRRAIAGYGMNPAGTWSPDGTQIVCLSYHEGRILVVDIPTGDASPVVEGREAMWLDDHTLVVEA